jgi:hypothetical protein
MTILKEIFLRYRTEGHVRFEIPAVACEPDKAERLIAGLRRIDGVYRVDVYRRARKLSIRYMATVVDFPALLRQLGRVVNELEMPRQPQPGPLRPMRARQWTEGLKNVSFVRWVREKYQEARETATAMGILARRGLRNPPALLKRENGAIQFLNDVLVFYLIKTHWHLITQHWLRRPLQYKYEWLSAFYLIFLLVRSRTPKAGSSPPTIAR